MDTLNCCGMRCPMPIVEAGKALRALNPGECIKIEADDPAFKADITAFCEHLGHVLQELSETTCVTATIQKKG